MYHLTDHEKYAQNNYSQPQKVFKLFTFSRSLITPCIYLLHCNKTEYNKTESNKMECNKLYNVMYSI